MQWLDLGYLTKLEKGLGPAFGAHFLRDFSIKNVPYLILLTVDKVSVSHLISFSRYQTKCVINPLNANPTKWPNTLKQFVGKLPTNCLSVFGHFVNLVLKGLRCYLDN